MKTTKVQPIRWPYLELVSSLGLDVRRNERRKKTGKGKKSSHGVECRIGSVIPESSRNNSLASLAGSMRRRGMSEAAIEAALQEENSARCHPPLSTSEVSSIAQSIGRYTPGDPGNVSQTLNDVGNADRFAARYVNRVKYVPEWKKWLIWTGTYWRQAEIGEIMEMAKDVARDIYHEGCDIADPAVRQAITKHSNQSQQLSKLQAMVTLAQSIPQLVAVASELNRNPDLLCVTNGVIDLKTGEIKPAEPSDLITQCSPVAFDPKVECPVFLDFLDTIMDRDKQLIQYLQVCLGYALTGHTKEQCLFFFYGTGANGKSTLLNVLKELLGPDFAMQTPSETLMVQRHGRSASNDLARLQHVRVALANEIEGGAFLAESLIKQMTGGDPIPARFLYAEFFEFVPRFKLFIAGNHKPVIRGDDHGIWRRIHLVPFEVTIPEEQRDPHLAEKLRAELPGILNWAIGGCLRWQKNGIVMPQTIKDAVQEYRVEMDIMGQWIAESVDVGEAFEWTAAGAYVNYREWAESNGFRPMTSTSFGRKLGERFNKKRSRDGVTYVGLRLRRRVSH